MRGCPAPGNGGQPQQYLGGPQATMCYFAAQFEKFPEGEKKVLRGRKREKRGDRQWVFSWKTSVVSTIHFSYINRNF